VARLLLLEDDENLRFGLEFNLKREGHEIFPAATGEDALALMAEHAFDLGIFDVMLPGMTGLQVLAEARRKFRHFPVMMLTARGDESDAVIGLRLGADDYVRKPFGVAELCARIESLLRRSAVSPARSGPIALGPWLLDLELRTATRGSKVVSLTTTEATLLSVLLEKDEAITREALLSRVWGVGSQAETRTLDNHVARLRKKLEDHPETPTFLLTVHGLGYRALRS
jgi:DNA-binding response OmpR family regulator